MHIIAPQFNALKVENLKWGELKLKTKLSIALVRTVKLSHSQQISCCQSQLTSPDSPTDTLLHIQLANLISGALFKLRHPTDSLHISSHFAAQLHPPFSFHSVFDLIHITFVVIDAWFAFCWGLASALHVFWFLCLQIVVLTLNYSYVFNLINNILYWVWFWNESD